VSKLLNLVTAGFLLCFGRTESGAPQQIHVVQSVKRNISMG
jgi:hypothetical protein